jgi:2-dehydropantoate 2-reductase
VALIDSLAEGRVARRHEEGSMGRYVIYGAGGVGGVLGGRLFEHGQEVVLIARGEHREAIAANGLTVDSPDGAVTLPVPVVGHPGEIDLTDDDVVILTMKSQDTLRALEDLAAVAPAGIALCCAQNGVANERSALRFFEHVYGMCVVCATTYLSPGVVKAHAAPVTGAFDIGRFPSGLDDRAQQIAKDLTAATWQTTPREEVMVWKYTKLLRNLANIIDALCGPGLRQGALVEHLRDEANAVLRAAGIETIPADGWGAERQALVRFLPTEGYESPAGSTWQSIIRNTGSIETDYLNGEIVLLGRLHGVPTPANELVCRLGDELARKRSGVGGYTEAELLMRLGA